MSDATPTQRNPYPGLRPFEADEKDFFFGRQADLVELRQRVEETRFLAVVGPSGSGKSSLLRAGLVPALWSGGSDGAWRIVVVRPGGTPVERLARELTRVFPSGNILESEIVRRDKLEAALRKDPRALVETVRPAGREGNEQCLVVVDPLEELLYLGDASDNAYFVRTLLDAAADRSGPVHVLVTLGADFVGDCDRFEGLPEAVSRNLYWMPRLHEDRLREVVEAPARAAGGTIAPEIVDRMLRDARDEAAPLPALQYVLRRIWDSTGTFGLAEYEAMGAMAEAVARDADAVIGELPEDQARAARKVFQCITTRLPDHRAVSRPTRFEEIPLVTGESEARVRPVLDKFRASGRAFIAPASSEPLKPDTVIEIAHECLITSWAALRAWVDEEDMAVRAYRRLEQAAVSRTAGGGLLSGAALEFAREKIAAKEWNVHWAQRLGGNYAAALSFFEESWRSREPDRGGSDVRRSLTRTRVFAGLLGVLLVSSLGLAFYTYERERAALARQEDVNRLREDALERQDAATQGLSRAALERGEADRQRNAALRQKEIAERQRKIAESQRKIAENQRRIAESESQRAEVRKRSDRQLLYVANMNLADRAFDEGNLVRGQEFLNAYLPVPGAAHTASDGDLRSFYWYHLWLDNHQEIETLRGHGDAVASVAFSPDGTALATASRDGGVRLWDPAKPEPLATLAGDGSALLSVAFSPDGRTLAAGSREGTVRLWNVEGREAAGTLAGKGGEVFGVAFSPDGKLLAAGRKDGDVSLWDVESRTPLASLPGHKRDVYSVAFSADGKILATGSQDDTVKLWDVGRREEIATLEGKGDDVHAVAFSPDGTLLAAGSKDGTLKLWDPASRKAIATLKGSGRDVYTVAFSPDGQLLVTGSRDGAVKVWDVRTRKELRTLKGHGDAVSSAAFSPKGGILATGSRDRTAKLWRLDVPKGQSTLAGKTPVFSIAFGPNGQKLATGSVSDTVSLWDLERRTQPVTLKGSGGVLFSVAFSPDGRTLVTGSKDGVAKLWDVSSGQEKGVLGGHNDVVFSVAFSPDGKTVATGSWDRTAKLWDATTGQETKTLQGHADSVFSVAFSPDGQTLATGSKDTTVKLWNVASGKEIATLTGHADAVFPVAFAPDGAILATASRDGVVKLWDVATVEEVGSLKGHVDSISSVFFSPDGRTLATGSLDDSVKLWDLETQQELATLKGHTNDVYSVAFSPGGKVLASGSLDGTVRLWEATTDEQVADQR